MGMDYSGGETNPYQGVFSVLSNLGRMDQARQRQEDRSREADNLARAAMIQAEDRAGEQREEAVRDAERVRERNRRERSRALISLGKSGVTLSGSPLAVLQGRSVEDEREYRTILNSGLDKADQTLAQGRVRAAQARSRGSSQDRLSTGLGLAGSLISTGPSLFGPQAGGR